MFPRVPQPERSQNLGFFANSLCVEMCGRAMGVCMHVSPNCHLCCQWLSTQGPFRFRQGQKIPSGSSLKKAARSHWKYRPYLAFFRRKAASFLLIAWHCAKVMDPDKTGVSDCPISFLKKSSLLKVLRMSFFPPIVLMCLFLQFPRVQELLSWCLDFTQMELIWVLLFNQYVWVECGGRKVESFLFHFADVSSVYFIYLFDFLIFVYCLMIYTTLVNVLTSFQKDGYYYVVQCIIL